MSELVRETTRVLLDAGAGVLSWEVSDLLTGSALRYAENRDGTLTITGISEADDDAMLRILQALNSLHSSLFVWHAANVAPHVLVRLGRLGRMIGVLVEA